LDAPHDRLKISGVEIRLRKLGRKLNMIKIHPHKFRRTMATRAIDKGMPIEQVQKILGHSQIDTTMHYYGKKNLMTSCPGRYLYLLPYPPEQLSIINASIR
ncbi:MAG: site-specific integrase, partial [Butyrivibrio hungatei]|nr:site-specific integrase [Butyrivibrio hungatei]